MTDAKEHDDEAASASAELDDKPPVLGSWRNIYLVVLTTLVVVITVFAVITQVYG